MKFSDLPDSETLRRWQELDRNLPSAHLRKIDELSRMTTQAELAAMQDRTRYSTSVERHLNEVSRMATHAERAAMEDRTRYSSAVERHVRELAERSIALDTKTGEQIRRLTEGLSASGNLMYQAMEKFQRQMDDMAKRFVQPAINHQVTKMLEGLRVNDFAERFNVGNAYHHQQVADIVQQLQTRIPADEIFAIRNSLAQVADAPIRAAMETFKGLEFGITATPTLNEFFDDALQQREPLTRKKLARVASVHLSKNKLSHLSAEEQFWLMFSISLLSMLITWFQLVQSGKPVKIDPDQFAKLSQPQINITNIFQSINSSGPVYYLVIRDCQLLAKPGRSGRVIHKISSGNKVQLLLSNHQWIYVTVENEGSIREGWVRKKHLKRLN
jgi:hypothetical protein